MFWLRGLFDILDLVISLVSSIHVDETLSPCLLWTLNFCLITRREGNYLRVISVKRRTRREDLKRVLLPLHGGEFCHPLSLHCNQTNQESVLILIIKLRDLHFLCVGCYWRLRICIILTTLNRKKCVVNIYQKINTSVFGLSFMWHQNFSTIM